MDGTEDCYLHEMKNDDDYTADIEVTNETYDELFNHNDSEKTIVNKSG